MADNNKLELVVEVDVNKANASIKSVNTGLSSMEQAATQAARGASQGIDGMTASMVKGATAGNLMADAIKSALAWVKDFTVGSVVLAAENSKVEASLKALASAHGVGAAAAMRQVATIEAIGFEFTEAAHAIQRFIVADIELAKAPGLAKLAKDAAAVQNIAAGEAIESIVRAIESGASRGLRTLGLFVDFQKETQIAQLQLGRTLTETEEKQIRLNAVMREGAKISGAHAAASQTVEGQLGALRREFNNLREDIGAEFQDDIKGLIGNMRDLVGSLRDNSDWLVKFGQGALVAVGIIGTITAATKAWALAQGAVNLALAVNPVTLFAAGAAGAGVVIYSEYRKMLDGQQRQFDDMRKQQIRQIAGEKGGFEKLHAQGMSDDDIRGALTGKRVFEPGDLPLATGPKIKVTGQPDLDALRLAAEIRKRKAENERFFAERAIAAGAAGKTGFAKEAEEMSAEIAKRTSFVDDRGKMHQVGLTPAALASIMDEARQKFDAYKEHVADSNRKVTAEAFKEERELAAKRLEWDGNLAAQRLKHNQEASEAEYEHTARLYGFEEQRAGFTRDARMRGLEGSDAQTVEQKIALEQRKADIEIEYLEKVHEVKQHLYDIETTRALMEEELTMKRLGYKADEITARINELSQQRQDIRDQTNEASDETVTAARENASNRATQMVREHNKQVFDSLKQQAGGVFDALLQKSQSVWSAIGNSLKTALLTAIKDVVTSRVAATLMGMLYGTQVSFAGSGGIGGQPVFGGGGGGAGLLGALGLAGAAGGGGGGSFGSVASIVGGPGGTSGFAGPVGLGGGGGGAGAGGGTGGSGGILGMLKGNLSGLKSFFGLGNISKDSQGGLWSTVGNQSINIDSLGGKLTALGKSDAAAAAGAGLFLDGIRRGGALGMAESTGGGALVGFKYGGPLGALIGGIAGAVAGGLRWAIGGDDDYTHASKLIKQLYGIDIPKHSDTIKQVLAMAKQNFGGAISVAVRSKEVRELVQLYADSTGQKSGLFAGSVRSASLIQSGGSLYQTATYRNGTPYTYGSYLPTLGPSGGTIPTASPMGGSVTVMVSPAATQDLWRTGTAQAIAGNPRGVAQAAVTGAGQSSARLNSAMTYLSPSTVLS